MRPCVIRELSRPNEALTYLTYQPPSFPPSMPGEPPTHLDTEAKPRGEHRALPCRAPRPRRYGSSFSPSSIERDCGGPVQDVDRSSSPLLATFYPMITLRAETRTPESAVATTDAPDQLRESLLNPPSTLLPPIRPITGLSGQRRER